jgi:diapolycopene oxygenase
MGQYQIGVIGGGLGGLAAACVLAGRGYKVVLLERNSWVGGKNVLLETDGFRFDMGPTILLMPSVLKRIWKDAGRKLGDYLDLIELDPQWRCFYEDGRQLNLWRNPGSMSEELTRFAPQTAAEYRSFLALSGRLNEISEKYFFYRSVGNVRDTFSMSGVFNRQVLSDLLDMRMGRTMAGTVRKFVSDGRVAQMLDHFTQYVGSNPEKAPAILCAIAQMQTGEGVWYPRGGTAALPAALSRLAIDLGVDIRTRCFVRRIDTEAGRVTGVVVDDGELIPLNAVVSNSDVVRTHQELLPRTVSEPFMNRRKYEPACSGVVLYLGLNKRYEHLAHHDFVFSRDPHEEFDSIYRKGEPAPDPTAYLCAPASTEANVAPPGGEALYVLVHTPYLRDHHDWKVMFPAYRKVIIEKLKRCGQMPDLEERIVVERHLTPQDINDRYHVLRGAIYGLASHGRFNGAFKPSNRSPDVAGLYLCGGSAHPGPGMPMVMMSGWIAADTLDQDRYVQPAKGAAALVGG